MVGATVPPAWITSPPYISQSAYRSFDPPRRRTPSRLFYRSLAACAGSFASMRPLPGGDALPSSIKPRSRKSSVDHAAPVASNVPTSFFMKTEGELEQSLASSSSTQTHARQRDSHFGVQSLADTLEAAFGPETVTTGKQVGSHGSIHHGKIATRTTSHSSSASSTKPSDTSKTSPVRKLKRKLSSHVSCTPATPHIADAPSPVPMSGISSTPSAVSLQSLKLSDDGSLADESGSQAVMSSGEEDGANTTTQQGSSISFPQLVMPSIQMPSRRPFTTKGKAMGKLKVMVAGETGMFFRRVLYGYPGVKVVLTVQQRPRKDVPHPFHRSALRRHRACRFPACFRTNSSTVSTQIQVSQSKP